MATIVRFPRKAARLRSLSGPPERGCELVAMGHVDLDTVIETIALLRSLEDQSFLDRFNRVDRRPRTLAAG